MRNRQTGSLSDNTPVYERTIDIFSRVDKDHTYVYLYSTRAARTCKEAVQRLEDAGRIFYYSSAGRHMLLGDCADILARFKKH